MFSQNLKAQHKASLANIAIIIFAAYGAYSAGSDLAAKISQRNQSLAQSNHFRFKDSGYEARHLFSPSVLKTAKSQHGPAHKAITHIELAEKNDELADLKILKDMNISLYLRYKQAIEQKDKVIELYFETKVNPLKIRSSALQTSKPRKLDELSKVLKSTYLEKEAVLNKEYIKYEVSKLQEMRKMREDNAKKLQKFKSENQAKYREISNVLNGDWDTMNELRLNRIEKYEEFFKSLRRARPEGNTLDDFKQTIDALESFILNIKQID
jgi:hypothetical protein